MDCDHWEILESAEVPQVADIIAAELAHHTALPVTGDALPAREA